MITQTSAVTFRQNLGEMLNQVQYRQDSIAVSYTHLDVYKRQVPPFNRDHACPLQPTYFSSREASSPSLPCRCRMASSIASFSSCC